MPLDLLIKGMQNFDGDQKPEKLVPSGRIEGEWLLQSILLTIWFLRSGMTVFCL